MNLELFDWVGKRARNPHIERERDMFRLFIELILMRARILALSLIIIPGCDQEIGDWQIGLEAMCDSKAFQLRRWNTDVQLPIIGG